jgi:hypothetical protein
LSPCLTRGIEIHATSRRASGLYWRVWQWEDSMEYPCGGDVSIGMGEDSAIRSSTTLQLQFHSTFSPDSGNGVSLFAGL